MDMENNPPQAEPVVELEPTEVPDAVVKPAASRPTLMIAIVVFVILSLAGLAYFLLKRPNTAIAPTLPIGDQAMVRPTPYLLSELDTADWQTYADPVVGFSLKYPKSVLLNDESEFPSQMVLSVVTEKLSDIPEDLPLMMGRKDALLEKAALEKGEEDVVKLGSVNGRLSTTYSRFEVCSVLFERTITFYQNEYRVKVTLLPPRAKLMAEMPDFFQVDPDNCGPNMMWNQDKKLDFESTLAAHEGVGVAQEWYDTFKTMVGTIQMVKPTATAAPATVKPTSAPASGSVYKNDTYGFQISYDKPYRLLTSKDDLSGYPKGVALLYTGGQAYNIVIEVWDNESDYKTEYASRLMDVTMIKSKEKYITLLNNTGEPMNQKIIDSFKLVP